MLLKSNKTRFQRAGPFWIRVFFWKNKMAIKRKFVCGVGIYDIERNVTFIDKYGKKWNYADYDKWHNMLERCYDQKFHARYPTYIGCTVCDDWLSFSSFQSWLMAQPNWQDWQLDKDVKVPGNKVYSPDTCMLIPAALNLFMCDSGAIRGKFPQGMSWHKQARKFYVQCCNPVTGKQEYLGLFTELGDAADAYYQAKVEGAYYWIEQMQDDTITNGLMAYLDRLSDTLKEQLENVKKEYSNA